MYKVNLIDDLDSPSVFIESHLLLFYYLYFIFS